MAGKKGPLFQNPSYFSEKRAMISKNNARFFKSTLVAEKTGHVWPKLAWISDNWMPTRI